MPTPQQQNWNWGGHNKHQPKPTPESMVEDYVYDVLRDMQLQNKAQKLPRGYYKRILAAVDRACIKCAIQHTKGNQVRASEYLGTNRNTLRERMRRYGIPTSKDVYQNGWGV